MDMDININNLIKYAHSIHEFVICYLLFVVCYLSYMSNININLYTYKFIHMCDFFIDMIPQLREEVEQLQLLYLTYVEQALAFFLHILPI